MLYACFFRCFAIAVQPLLLPYCACRPCCRLRLVAPTTQALPSSTPLHTPTDPNSLRRTARLLPLLPPCLSAAIDSLLYLTPNRPHSYVVPLVFFHFCRKWSTTRDDIATNDNRGILPLGPSLPVTSLPSHGGGAGGGGSLAVNNRSGSGSKVGSDGASRHQSASALGSYGGGLGTGSAGSGEEVRLDMELAQRASSAPLVLDEVQRPPSPVKQAVRKAWDALSDLPGKAGRAAGVTPSSHHRRTESMEPVLLGEDQSASSLGS